MEPEVDYEREELLSTGLSEYVEDLLPSVSPDQDTSVVLTGGDTETVSVRSVVVYMETDGAVDINDSGGTTLVTLPTTGGNARRVPLRDGGIVVVPPEGTIDASSVTTGVIRVVPIQE